MSTSKWFWSLLVLNIPIVGFVMLFVWAFGSDADERQGFARATLLWGLVGLVLSLLAFVIIPLSFGLSMFWLGT